MVFIIAVSCGAKIVIAQSPLQAGARSVGMANATTGMKDASVVWTNPAAVAGVKSLEIVSSLEHRPNLPGADRTSAIVALPLFSGALAGGVYRFGDAAYSESLLSVAYGHQLGMTSLGFRIDLIQFRTEDMLYLLPGVSFGGIADITPRCAIGAWASNLNQPRMAGERLPVRMAAGPLFRPVETVVAGITIEKDMAYDISLRSGIECRIHKKFFVRTGYRLFPTTAFFGTGFHTWKLRFDYAMHVNEATGYGHQVSLAYFSRQKKIANK